MKEEKDIENSEDGFWEKSSFAETMTGKEA